MHQRHQVGQGDVRSARGSLRMARAHAVADFVQDGDQFSAFHAGFLRVPGSRWP